MSTDLLSAGEAARLLGLSHTYLTTLEAQGKLLPAARIDTGHKQARVYRRLEVEQLAAERQQSAMTG